MLRTVDGTLLTHVSEAGVIPSHQSFFMSSLHISATASIRVLPPELVDGIVDLCHDDPTLLRALSLVSKAWLPRCRHHIFSLIQVEVLMLPAFFELGTQPNSFLLHSVRSLWIEYFNNDTQRSVVLTTYLPQLTLLSNLRSLSLLVYCDYIRDELENLPTLPTVTRFQVSGSFILPSTLKVLPAFPHLEALSLKISASNGEALSTSRILLDRLRRLEICASESGIIKPLTSQLSLPCLESVELLLSSEVVAFVQKFGHSICHLQLHIPRDPIRIGLFEFTP